MIKSNELRIGNYVFDADNDILQIAEIFREGVSFVGSNIKNYHSSIEPIPLTEEWLLKFGFEKSMAWTYAIEIGNNKRLVYYLGEKGWSIGFMRYSEFSNLKYVHQLQNLLFALTGKEL